MDERLKEEVAALRDVLRVDGLERLIAEVRERTHEAASLDYRLEDKTGKFLAGNLPSPRAKNGQYSEGWVRLVDPAPAAGSEGGWERARVTTLDGGVVLVVGRELNGVRDARRAVLAAFAWALAATLALGAGGGLVVSAAFLRRIDLMTRTAQGIIAGDLGQRIPVANEGDDLGRLARTLNQMLDRIETLLEANKQVSSDIAHDLRSPLARVLRRLEATRTHSAGLAEYEDAVDATISDVNAIIATFGALLRIGQIEAGARRAGFKNVDLSAIALEVAEAFQPAAADEGKTLTIDPLTPMPMSGDRELLTQLVANLIDNAIRHTPIGSRIEVSASQGLDGGQLIVADNGPGVPHIEEKRIFERFYRVDASRATPGDGLGLSLVAAIAELHGAKITVGDNGPGLRVVVVIPRIGSDAARDS